MNFESRVVEVSMDLNHSKKAELPRLLREMAVKIEAGLDNDGNEYHQWEVNG